MFYDSIFNSKNEEESESGKKVPKGFEKFLRKTKKSAGGSSKDVDDGVKGKNEKDVKKE